MTSVSKQLRLYASHSRRPRLILILILIPLPPLTSPHPARNGLGSLPDKNHHDPFPYCAKTTSTCHTTDNRKITCSSHHGVMTGLAHQSLHIYLYARSREHDV